MLQSLFCVSRSDRAPLKSTAACKRTGSVVGEEGGDGDIYYENILYVFRKHFLEEMQFGFNKRALTCLSLCAVLNVKFLHRICSFGFIELVHCKSTFYIFHWENTCWYDAFA